MNKYIKLFLHRGLVFGGFGPIITGFVFYMLSLNNQLDLSGLDIFIAILSTYILAFVQAGSSIFNQIEHWSTIKGLGIHLLTLYIIYVVCYLSNSWIPFDWKVILIFTIIFVALYLLIWLIVVLIIKKTTSDMNKAIE
jgi:hypothetical protein